MKGSLPTRTTTGARLFIAYALASLLPVLGLGALLAFHARESGMAQGLTQGRAQAAVITQMAVAPALNGADLSLGLTSNERNALQRATDVAIFRGSLTAVRLRNFSGAVVFSDNGSSSDPLSSSDPEFHAAAHGSTRVSVVPAPAHMAGRAIRVLQPVIPNADGQSVGVLELYLPYAPIAAAIDHETHQTYVLLAIGLVVLYLVLGAISWSTTTRLRRHAARQAHQAMHDPLTGLANRVAFRRFAERAIADRERGGALVLVDLNRFKEVNDTLGHHVGDVLLENVAQRLVDAVRTDDHVARLGGDEFGLVLPGATDHDEVLGLLDMIHHKLGAVLEIEGSVLTIEASVGVVVFPEQGTSLDQLMVDADAAMYQSKRGLRQTVLYQPGATPLLSTRSHEVQAELQRALDEDELVLHYQPKIDLRTGEVPAVEALVRWNHPTRGLVGPQEFVPVAEKSTLIEPFTRWVLRHALGDLREWRAVGAPWAVAVNVSAHNLAAPDFPETVTTMLAETGCTPDDLILELTETALTADTAGLIENIAALAALGIAVSIDDFGTGSSGLRQLRGLAAREIKIDQVFVRDVAANRHDANLVAAIVQLAHGLDCTVVAEGVEDSAAVAVLRAAGCDQAQGFHYRRPAPWQQLIDNESPAGRDLADPRSLEPTPT